MDPVSLCSFSLNWSFPILTEALVMVDQKGFILELGDSGVDTFENQVTFRCLNMDIGA